MTGGVRTPVPDTPPPVEAIRRARLARAATQFGLERNTAAAAGAMFLMALGEHLWRRFLPKYLEVLGAPVLAIGADGSTEDFLDALYQYPGGWIGDRYGRRRALVLLVGLAAVGYGIVALAPTWHAGAGLDRGRGAHRSGCSRAPALKGMREMLRPCPPEGWDLEEIGASMGRSRKTVWEWVDQGDLEAYMFRGREYRVHEDALHRFLRRERGEREPTGVQEAKGFRLSPPLPASKPGTHDPRRADLGRWRTAS